jgi:capsular exopolysaccharide synthesis family protein
MYSNKPNLTPTVIDEEIDLQDMLATIKRYRVSIVAILVITTLLALIYTVATTKVYQANLQLQIKTQMIGESSGGQNDFLDKALDVKGENLENEIAVLQSHFVVSKAIEKLQIGTHYYLTKQFKSVELYKNSPFSVNVEAMAEPLTHYMFQLRAIDNDHFLLSIEPTLGMKVMNFFRSLAGNIPSDEKPVYFKGTFLFGTPISNSFFTLTVNKIGDMAKDNYTFNVTGHDFLVGVIQKALRVSAVSDKSSILLISYEDNIPLRAKDVLNAIAEAYQEQNIETKKASAQKTLNFIDKQLKGLNITLQNSASELEGYKTKHIVMDPKDKAVMTAQKINELEKEKYELDMQEGVYQKLLKDMQENKSVAGLNTGSISTFGTPLLPLFEKLQEANTLRASLLIDYTDQHPSVIKVNKQIESLKTNLKATIESSLRGIQQRKIVLNEIVQKNNGVLQEIPEEENQLSHLNNDFLLNQKNYEYLLQKRAEIAIAESSTISIVRVIDEALVREFPIKPVPILNIFLGIILGFTFGMIQAFIRNYFANTVHTASDIEKHTHLPLLSVLPLFAERKTLFNDALRVLLTKLEFHTLKPKVINITSSIEGEGKTTMTLELANVIGQSGKKAIILDLDMRSPKIHKRLNLNNNSGMSTFLSGESVLENVIHHTEFYDVISAGPIHAYPYKLLMSDTLKIALQDLRDKYDYIILQSPPVGLVADALVLMRLSDVSMIVFKALYSKKDFVHYISRFAKEHQIETLGIVLNSIELDKIRPWRKIV